MDPETAEKFENATFKSTKIEKLGVDTGIIHGELTMLGKTKPLKLQTVFNGHGDNPFSKKKTLGFSATTIVKRSEFGMDAYLPAVGDEVELVIQVEFQKQEDKAE